MSSTNFELTTKTCQPLSIELHQLPETNNENISVPNKRPGHDDVLQENCKLQLEDKSRLSFDSIDSENSTTSFYNGAENSSSQQTIICNLESSEISDEDIENKSSLLKVSRLANTYSKDLKVAVVGMEFLPHPYVKEYFDDNNKGYDLDEHFYSIDTLVNVDTSSSNLSSFIDKSLPHLRQNTGDIDSEETLTMDSKQSVEIKSSSTLIMAQIDSFPTAEYHSCITSNEILVNVENLMQHDKILSSILKSVSFDENMFLNSVANFKRYPQISKSYNNHKECIANRDVIVTIPNDMLKNLVNITNTPIQLVNTGDGVMKDNVVNNVLNKSYSHNHDTEYSKNIKLPDANVIHNMIKGTAKDIKRTCAEEYRCGEPTNIPELWEMIITVIDKTVKRLEVSISEKILNEIKNLPAFVSKPNGKNVEDDEIKVLSMSVLQNKPRSTAQDSCFGDYIQEMGVQCNLIEKSILDALAIKRFDEDISVIDKPKPMKVRNDIIGDYYDIKQERDSRKPCKVDTLTHTTLSIDDYEEPQSLFRGRRLLRQLISAMFSFSKDNVYLFASVVMFFSVTFLVYAFVLFIAST